MTPFTRFYWTLYARCVGCIALVATVACVSIIWLFDQETRETGEQALRASTGRAVSLVRPFLEGRGDAAVVTGLRQLAEQGPGRIENLLNRQEIHAARLLGTGFSTQYVKERDQLAAYAALPVYGSAGALLGFVRGFAHIPVRYAASQGDRKSDLLALILIGGLALALAVLPVLGTYFTYRRMA